MLYHDSSRRIVKSTNENIKQHQVSSWIINDNHFEFTDETDEKSKFVDKYLKQLTTQIGQDNIEDVFEAIFDFIEESGIKNYEDIKVFDALKLKKAIGSLKNITQHEKTVIDTTIRQAIKELSRMIYEEGRQSISKKLNIIDEQN